MDPKENLAEQARLIATMKSDRARLKELREALREWRAKGGFG